MLQPLRQCKLQCLYLLFSAHQGDLKHLNQAGLKRLERRAPGWPTISWKRRGKLKCIDVMILNHIQSLMIAAVLAVGVGALPVPAEDATAINEVRRLKDAGLAE